MIALLIAQAVAAATVPGTPLAAIGKQDLPAKGCAAYLWSTAPDHMLVAMAGADPPQLRLAIDGGAKDYARASETGTGGYGFAGTTEYRGGDIIATLDLQVATRADLTGGATVPQATLRIDRPGHDSVVVPVAGLIGCGS